MPNALWICNESERIADVRAVLNCYRAAFSKARNVLSNLLARYLARSCPRCNGYVGITIREPRRNVPLQTVNGRCSRYSYRMAWIVIRGKRAERDKICNASRTGA